jgi:hypothetical protein
MRDAVMQVAGDPQPLLGDPPPRLFLPGALQVPGAFPLPNTAAAIQPAKITGRTTPCCLESTAARLSAASITAAPASATRRLVRQLSAASAIHPVAHTGPSG